MLGLQESHFICVINLSETLLGLLQYFDLSQTQSELHGILPWAEGTEGGRGSTEPVHLATARPSLATMLRPGPAAMLRPGPGTVALMPSEVAPAALHRLQSLGEQVQGLGDCRGSSSPPCQDVGSAIWKGALVSLGTATPPAQGGQKHGNPKTWHYAYILYSHDRRSGLNSRVFFFLFFSSMFSAILNIHLRKYG